MTEYTIEGYWAHAKHLVKVVTDGGPKAALNYTGRVYALANARIIRERKIAVPKAKDQEPEVTT